ncbi:MAG: mechanosensitive ion channel family protein [Rickettsia endosymbiont of Bryobia graminum]|nr:mechanosensitive ion channel family protein [Rickettsia endosymbiont of Bryobia graminum]
MAIITQWIEYLLDIYNKYHTEILWIMLMIAGLLPIILIIKKCVFSMIKSCLNKKYGDYDKIIERNHVYTYLLHALVSIYLIFCGKILNSFSNPDFINLGKNIFITLYTTISFTLLALSIINTLYEVGERKISDMMRAPLSLVVQILKIMIICIAAVILISCILNISPTAFFTSLGAAAALLTFVFKDSVTGVLSSVQIISQDMVRIGDHITIPSLNVDGVVEQINITVIKIRNFDQTISTIPTGSILTTNVVNMRGIKERAAKKIQRALCIDIETINFVPSSFLQELKKSSYIVSKALDEVKIENNNNALTNIKIFRSYITEYLKNNPTIYKHGFTFVVRQLAPTTTGLPIELFIFTNEINLPIYEEVQAEIFDHLLAILPEFKLKIFQEKY